MPPDIPVWTRALAAIDTSPGNLVVTLALGHSFNFPSPSVFVGSSRIYKYIGSWLSWRRTWAYAVANKLGMGTLPAATAAQWRDLLSAGWGAETVRQKLLIHDNPATPGDKPVGSWPITDSTTETTFLREPGKGPPNMVHHGREAKKRKKHRENAVKMFEVYMDNPRLPEQFAWREKLIMQGQIDQIGDDTCAEVLWDLYEHNFRFEILALDRVVHVDEWKDPAWAASRDAAIQRVFSGNTGYFVGDLPTHNEGLADEDLHRRLPYLESFSDVCNLYPGFKQSMRIEVKMERLDKENLRREAELVKLYCQTFFNHLGRIPTPPHRLPVARGCIQV